MADQTLFFGIAVAMFQLELYDLCFCFSAVLDQMLVHAAIAVRCNI